MYSKVKHECEHFKQDLGKKCEEFKKLEKEFAKQRKLFLSELNSVKQEKRDLQIRMFEFENQKHELENNLIDVDMQTDKLKLSLNDARTQKKLLEENNQELKSNLQKCYKENFELDNKIGVLEGRIHDYEINSKELQNENDCLQEQIRELFSLRKQFFDIKLLIGNLDNYRQIFQKYIKICVLIACIFHSLILFQIIQRINTLLEKRTLQCTKWSRNIEINSNKT